METVNSKDTDKEWQTIGQPVNQNGMLPIGSPISNDFSRAFG